MRSPLLVISFILFYSLMYGQNIFENQKDAQRITPSELGIPASPIFDLMGVTPSQVVRTTDIKDFKVDWSLKSWTLSPNLSLQSQPVWELFYNRRPISKYQKASKIKRLLTTLDISAGSVQNEELNRRIGFAAKMGLYRQKDPLLQPGIYDDVEESIVAKKKELDSLLVIAKANLAKNKNILDKPALMTVVQNLEFELGTLGKQRQDAINERSLIVVNEFWNASFIDIGAGKINTFFSDAFGNLDSLRLDRNTATGLWLTGGVGVGKYSLVSFLLRGHKYSENVDFKLENIKTGALLDTNTVAGNTLLTLGINYRYGNPFFTFFTEFIYERKGTTTPFEAVEKSFKPTPQFVILEQSVDWNIVHPFTINFGGDWRMNKNVILNFGIRAIYNKSFKLNTFLPVVGISCIMR
jgi:hypothetical protein